MSDLVGNPEDRFSRVAAHLAFVRVSYKCHCIFNTRPVNVLKARSMHFYASASENAVSDRTESMTNIQ